MKKMISVISLLTFVAFSVPAFAQDSEPPTTPPAPVDCKTLKGAEKKACKDAEKAAKKAAKKAEKGK